MGTDDQSPLAKFRLSTLQNSKNRPQVYRIYQQKEQIDETYRPSHISSRVLYKNISKVLMYTTHVIHLNLLLPPISASTTQAVSAHPPPSHPHKPANLSSKEWPSNATPAARIIHAIIKVRRESPPCIRKKSQHCCHRILSACFPICLKSLYRGIGVPGAV